MDRYLKLSAFDLGHRLPPEGVEAFGKQAASLHVDEGVDLTRAVLMVVRNKALNPSHVCRITEKANQEAYLMLYDQCDPASRAVTFDGGPARIFEILETVFT